MPSAEDLIKQLHAQRARARRRESVIMERVYTPPAGGGGGGGSDNLSAPASTELVLRVMQQFQEANAALHRRMDELQSKFAATNNPPGTPGREANLGGATGVAQQGGAVGASPAGGASGAAPADLDLDASGALRGTSPALPASPVSLASFFFGIDQDSLISTMSWQNTSTPPTPTLCVCDG